ncbi:DNA repair protein RecO [Polyangium aurulentum]|uniref:DNA repair protein RecO n=1 Tax=Polyangium aurulentum TaxID=2567896 RepID=UPI0010AEA477|nr:DNA repair protein RecO [Polyangium aurulentum]UQA59995.1 DNA repair protein RecO [Polyangium aurulentum]
MPRPTRKRVEPIRTEALLVRRVPVGEADLIITLFTEARGMMGAVARSARRTSKRFAGLEPMHLLRVSLEERAGSDLALLVEASIAKPRLHLTTALDRLEAAGRALRWIRGVAPPGTPEPGLFCTVNDLLDALDVAPPEGSVNAHLATAGLRMLGNIGFGLVLDRCVHCGKPCAPEATACLDAEAGGLVCRACGGARLVVRSALRARIEAAAAGDDAAILAEDAQVVVDLVEAALSAHAAPAR